MKPVYYQTTPAITYEEIVSGRLQHVGIAVQTLHPLLPDRVLLLGAESLLMSLEPIHNFLFFRRSPLDPAPTKISAALRRAFGAELIDEDHPAMWFGFDSMETLIRFSYDVRDGKV
jgi:hypothetical protein